MKIEVASRSGGITINLQTEAFPDAFESLPERPPGIESNRCKFADILEAVLQQMIQVTHQARIQVQCQAAESQVVASGDVLKKELIDVSDRSARYQKYKGASVDFGHEDDNLFYLTGLWILVHHPSCVCQVQPLKCLYLDD